MHPRSVSSSDRPSLSHFESTLIDPPKPATLPSDLASCHALPSQLLATARMDEMMLFLVVFMGSPAHVKSSHLRSKMSEVLHAWLPQVWEPSAKG